MVAPCWATHSDSAGIALEMWALGSRHPNHPFDVSPQSPSHQALQAEGGHGAPTGKVTVVPSISWTHFIASMRPMGQVMSLIPPLQPSNC